MAKVKEKEVEIIETEKSVFESFIASLEAARNDIDEVVKKGYEILGIETEETSEEEQEVDINDLDLDGLLEAAESYDVTVPNKIVAKGVEAVRSLLKEALGLEEEVSEGEEEEAPEEEEEEEIATKVKTKLKKEIEKKKLLKKK